MKWPSLRRQKDWRENCSQDKMLWKVKCLHESFKRINKENTGERMTDIKFEMTYRFNAGGVFWKTKSFTEAFVSSEHTQTWDKCFCVFLFIRRKGFKETLLCSRLTFDFFLYQRLQKTPAKTTSRIRTTTTVTDMMTLVWSATVIVGYCTISTFIKQAQVLQSW